MEGMNYTRVTEFILEGVTDNPELNKILLGVIFVFYLTNLVGNISIISVVLRDTKLHTPMYFLLVNLSIQDIGMSSLIVPKILINELIGKKTISYEGCITQLYFLHFFGTAEALLLTSMSYDRYVAICHPLRYVVIINERVCILLASVCWSLGFCHSLLHIILTIRLPFCSGTEISHFYCDFKPLFMLACADTHINESLVTIIIGIFTVTCFSLIFVSYVFIGYHLLKIKSSKGRQKAFSTCASHLTIVVFFVGTCMCTYLRTSSSNAVDSERIAAILFTVVSPALNPYVYSLRNKDVKTALRKMFSINRE